MSTQWLQIDPGTIAVVKNGTTEVGFMWAENASSGSLPYSFAEHQWFYPGYPASGVGVSYSLAVANPLALLGVAQPTMAACEAYVKSKNGGSLTGLKYQVGTITRSVL